MELRGLLIIQDCPKLKTRFDVNVSKLPKSLASLAHPKRLEIEIFIILLVKLACSSCNIIKVTVSGDQSSEGG